MTKKRIKNYLGRNFKKEKEMDKLSSEKRSILMSKIRSRNTKFEDDFIKIMRRQIKGRFQTHIKEIKGTPDIVFKNKKVCVFLDSNFWHGWQFPRWKHLLKNKFWVEKIANNRKRDARVTQHLRRNGWKVIRVWEYEIKEDKDEVLLKIKQALKNYY